MPIAFDSAPSRRGFLSLLASAALALPSVLGFAADDLVGRLIRQSGAFPGLSRRIDFISAALLGKHYRADTLIGGPATKEKFVVRDDGFDCVTYCEVVLAAAQAHDLPSFETQLRTIRYRNGVIAWRERNHDWAAWCERNVAKGRCREISLGEPVILKKSIGWPSQLGRRDYSIAAIPSAELLSNKDKLANGDIIGFVSRQPSLDYFHTGFVMFGPAREFLLRHASLSHGEVVNERMVGFLTANRVRYVTLLRPVEKAA
ncbi:MAG: N-acetylmuramoyl-L-alanine amidase-like domain-containing protein [Pseudolabrys sp.]